MVLSVAMLLSLGLFLPHAQEEASPARVQVINQAPVTRTMVVNMSVPFARGLLPAELPGDGREVPIDVVVRGAGAERQVPGLPLLRWPDGSIAVLQVQARCTVAASTTVDLQVTPVRNTVGKAVAAVATEHHPALVLPVSLWTELVDSWGRVLRAELVPDLTAGPGGVLSDTGLVRVTRFRAAHFLQSGVVKDGPLCDLRGYLKTFDGEHIAELTLLLDNQEPSAGALGPIRFSGFRMCTGNDRLRFLPSYPAENLMPPPSHREGGGFEQWLLRPSAGNYLGDGTAKAFRLTLFQEPAELSDEARDIAQWNMLPLLAFASLDTVRKSRAFGLGGGPAPRLGADPGIAANQLMALRATARYGPFGGFGDPENCGLTGAPRQGDSLLHNVLRWQSVGLLQAADGMVLQHALRPTAGRRERLQKDTESYREGIQQLALAAPHGFTAPDYEHASAALLFDYYWLTGDALARDELQRLGNGIARLLPAVPFCTSRGEGVCLEALVLCARATGDQALLAIALRRAKDVVLPAIAAAVPHIAIAQPPHPEVLEGKTAFDAPWQMALLVRGLAAVQQAASAAELCPAIVRIADAIATLGWVEGTGSKTFVSATDVSRYSIAALPSDQAGYDRMTIGAFELAIELTDDPAVVSRLQSRVRFLLQREIPPAAGLLDRVQAHANPWLQIALDRQPGTK
ncbi:MAG: hypothetical protein EXS02_13955 [Planctomycetes bacterium]|nr:hypothetical protein [Planctomycetota bacterium]